MKKLIDTGQCKRAHSPSCDYANFNDGMINGHGLGMKTKTSAHSAAATS